MKYWLELLKGKAYKIRKKAADAHPVVVGLIAFTIIASILFIIGVIDNSVIKNTEGICPVAIVFVAILAGIIRIIAIGAILGVLATLGVSAFRFGHLIKKILK